MKLILISKNSNKIQKYLSETTTITVEAAFDTLAGSLARFEQELFRVDKLIFVYYPGMEIRAEIIAMGNLFMTSGSLFRVNEIVYIYQEKEGDLNTDHLGMLTATYDDIKEAARKNRAIRVPDLRTAGIPGDLGFGSIRDAIVGSSEVNPKLAESVGVYIRDKNSVEKQAFESNPEDPKSIHPFNFTRISGYNSTKERLMVTESTQEIYETPQNIPKDPNIDIPLFTVPSMMEPRFFVFSGLPASGTTTNATAMISSALQKDRKLFVLDISTTGDIDSNLKIANIPFHQLTDRELLSMKSFEEFPETNLLLYRCTNKSLKYHVIFFIVNRLPTFLRDYLFVDCDLYELNTVHSALNSSLCYTCLSSSMFETSVDKLQKVDFKDSFGIIMLNDTQKCPELKFPMLKSKIRELFPSEIRIAPPTFYSSFEVDGGLFDSILAISKG